MRALVISIGVGLCACLPGDFDDLGHGTNNQPAAGADAGAPDDAADASPPEDAAGGASDMDAATGGGTSAIHDASSREASIAAGPHDASAGDDARLEPTCLAPRTQCGRACIDPRTDPAHCGSCDAACDPGKECVERECLPPSGCSDDTREGFADRAAFPAIAGCAAAWPRASMRAPRALSACGNSAGMCGVPADACARGWHVCGNAADGPADVTARVTSAQCNTTPGRWAGALGDISCADCSSASVSGSICCGADCVQQNNDCLWPGETAWFGVVKGVTNLCNGTENPTLYADVGVLCCRDAAADAGTGKGSLPDGVLF